MVGAFLVNGEKTNTRIVNTAFINNTASGISGIQMSRGSITNTSLVTAQQGYLFKSPRNVLFSKFAAHCANGTQINTNKRTSFQQWTCESCPYGKVNLKRGSTIDGSMLQNCSMCPGIAGAFVCTGTNIMVASKSFGKRLSPLEPVICPRSTEDSCKLVNVLHVCEGWSI